MVLLKAQLVMLHEERTGRDNAPSLVEPSQYAPDERKYRAHNEKRLRECQDFG